MRVDRCKNSPIQCTAEGRSRPGHIENSDKLLAAWKATEKVAKIDDPVSLALLKRCRGRQDPGPGLLYEIEDIGRFPREQDFASYCRLVSGQGVGRQAIGHSGKKIGNAHLRWAFSEATVLMLKGNKPARQVLQKIASKHGKGKALAILAHRLGRAVYYMLKNQVPFDQERFLRRTT